MPAIISKDCHTFPAITSPLCTDRTLSVSHRVPLENLGYLSCTRFPSVQSFPADGGDARAVCESSSFSLSELIALFRDVIYTDRPADMSPAISAEPRWILMAARVCPRTKHRPSLARSIRNELDSAGTPRERISPIVSQAMGGYRTHIPFRPQRTIRRFTFWWREHRGPVNRLQCDGCRNLYARPVSLLDKD